MRLIPASLSYTSRSNFTRLHYLQMFVNSELCKSRVLTDICLLHFLRVLATLPEIDCGCQPSS